MYNNAYSCLILCSTFISTDAVAFGDAHFGPGTGPILWMTLTAMAVKVASLTVHRAPISAVTMVIQRMQE